MIGAIAGDMIGSPYEAHPVKHKNFTLLVSDFTDDTVLTVAVADAVMTGVDMAGSIRSYARKYASLPCGGSFKRWMWSEGGGPYNS